ncbi:MAG: class A beta-lactamase [Pseudomonadota bacterium]
MAAPAFCVGALTAGCAGFARNDDFASSIRALEIEAGGRLGVALTLPSGSTIGHRLDERFALCSTFKVLLAAMVLREAQAGRLALDESVSFSEADMVSYAPVTSTFLSMGSMSVEQLAQATQSTSDNVAANLLLKKLGGPEGFTARLRELGDTTTRLDRYETELNIVPPGEIRDTTTPRAMANTLYQIFDGTSLHGDRQRQLKEWMVGTTTGKARLRAGLPDHWVAGDKTGTGVADVMPSKYNDVAVVWTGRGQEAFTIAAYFDAPGPFGEFNREYEKVISEVGRLVTRRIMSQPH